jgi:hypothetical protein
MDGLSISVVPTDRAGMAAGIFNTARVAGEGVTLAIVGALLAGLVRSHLEYAAIGLPHTAIAEAAHRVATGDMAHAVKTLPEIAPSVMVASYADAFQSLLHILTVITVLSAMVVFAFLAKPARSTNPVVAEEQA